MAQLKTSDSIVAFVDVLGAKKMIQDDVDQSLNIVHEIYQKSLDLYERVFKDRVPFDISIFSDNIVIARKIPDNNHLEAVFTTVQLMAAIVQGNFLFRGLLVRGGIAHGSFFKDDIMIWGEALTKVYSLESSAAIYPRIVVDPELVGELNIFPRGIEKTQFWLKQDTDGLVFVDYLQERFIKDYDLALLQEIRRFDDRVIENQKNTKVIQKYLWHASYINSKLAVGESNA